MTAPALRQSSRQPIRASITEARLQQTVHQLCSCLRLLHYHTHDSRRSNAGWPDLAIIRADELLLRELKSERGAVRPEQRTWLDALAQVRRVSVGVWRPADWLDGRIEQELRGIGIAREWAPLMREG